MRVLFETLDLPGEDLTLVYRVPNKGAIVFREELDEIAARKGARGDLLDRGLQRSGRALPEHSYTLRGMVGPLATTTSLVLARARMAGRLRESLLHTGHSRRQLHEEQFAFSGGCVLGFEGRCSGFDRLSPQG